MRFGMLAVSLISMFFVCANFNVLRKVLVVVVIGLGGFVVSSYTNFQV